MDNDERVAAVLEDLATRVRGYQGLMRALDARLREVEALRAQAANLRESIEKTADELRKEAPYQEFGVDRVLFFTLSDCFGTTYE
jgi:hypothetical protein